jgi:sulfur carrier protein
VQIIVNGRPEQLPENATIEHLLATMGLTGRRVAVEYNGSIVPRFAYADTHLADGDCVEVVHAIGGG